MGIIIFKNEQFKFVAKSLMDTITILVVQRKRKAIFFFLRKKYKNNNNIQLNWISILGVRNQNEPSINNIENVTNHWIENSELLFKKRTEYLFGFLSPFHFLYKWNHSRWQWLFFKKKKIHKFCTFLATETIFISSKSFCSGTVGQTFSHWYF